MDIVFGSHFYIFEGQIFQQTSGCPMGLEGSSHISRLVMDAWVTITKKTIELNNLCTTLTHLSVLKSVLKEVCYNM